MSPTINTEVECAPCHALHCGMSVSSGTERSLVRGYCNVYEWSAILILAEADHSKEGGVLERPKVVCGTGNLGLDFLLA